MFCIGHRPQVAFRHKNELDVTIRDVEFLKVSVSSAGQKRLGRPARTPVTSASSPSP